MSCFIFRSLNHFAIIFVYGVNGVCSNFIVLHVAVQFPQNYFLRRLSCLHCMLLLPVSQMRLSLICGFISGLSVLFHLSIFMFLCQYHNVLMTVAL